jgi:ubiquinone/menaquinone biosynthesis C-methylase UbiE
MALTDSRELIGRRYDRLAPIYRPLELGFGLPSDIRRRAVAALALRPGERVLELGCGSGRNLEPLAAAIGPRGTILGADLSAGMLARAERLVEHRGWCNVTLLRQDAGRLEALDTFDGVLFSLSYSVIPERRVVLGRAWAALRAGGRLVIMDACLPDGRRGRWLRPLALALSRASVLGDPSVRPWEDLAELTCEVRSERLRFGIYCIAVAHKPSSAGAPPA